MFSKVSIKKSAIFKKMFSKAEHWLIRLQPKRKSCGEFIRSGLFPLNLKDSKLAIFEDFLAIEAFKYDE